MSIGGDSDSGGGEGNRGRLSPHVVEVPAGQDG